VLTVCVNEELVVTCAVLEALWWGLVPFLWPGVVFFAAVEVVSCCAAVVNDWTDVVFGCVAV
jgi:hypothetical protein